MINKYFKAGDQLKAEEVDLTEENQLQKITIKEKIQVQMKKLKKKVITPKQKLLNTQVIHQQSQSKKNW